MVYQCSDKPSDNKLIITKGDLNMVCKNKVMQCVPNRYGYKMVKSSCGCTGINGELLLCDSCIEKAEKEFPQGWRNVPGDICKHGNYVGNCYGPDYICRKCEDE